MKALAEIVLYDSINSSQQKLISGLRSNGYEAHSANKIEELSEIILQKKIDLFIFNIHSDFKVINSIVDLVTDHYEELFIILSDSNSPKERLFALEAGIFEFLTGPYLMKEVMIHVGRAVSYKKNSGHVSNGKHVQFDEFGDFLWNSLARELWTKKGFRIELTETETAILEYFIRNPEKELSRDEIWYVLRNRERWPLDRTLDGHIARLRSKLQDSKEGGNGLIKSVRGKGYVFRPFSLYKSFDEMSATSKVDEKQISL
jgi:two-component system, OmpR family, response regulator